MSILCCIRASVSFMTNYLSILLEMQFIYSSDSKAISSKTAHVSCLEILFQHMSLLTYSFDKQFVVRYFIENFKISYIAC